MLALGTAPLPRLKTFVGFSNAVTRTRFSDDLVWRARWRSALEAARLLNVGHFIREHLRGQLPAGSTRQGCSAAGGETRIDNSMR